MNLLIDSESLVNFPIAITAILIVAPVTRKFVDKITKSS